MKLSLFIATSLDGSIARHDGAIDWLFADQDYGYAEFYRDVDAVVMGRKTFDQLDTLTSEYPYPGVKSYVVTRTPQQYEHPAVEFVEPNVDALLSRWRDAGHEKVWVVGGGQLNTLLAPHLDELIVSVHPRVLGYGTALFAGAPLDLPLTLHSCRSFETGLLQLRYIPYRPS